MARRNESEEERAARKAAAKAAKAEKRAERQGLGDATKGRKPCSLCGRPRDLLIRCQVDATLTWHMSCGKCWLAVSGGEVDGSRDRPYYRYGGLWKNHHKVASGRNKVPSEAKVGVKTKGDGGRGGAARSRARSGVAAGRGQTMSEDPEGDAGVADVEADAESSAAGSSGDEDGGSEGTSGETGGLSGTGSRRTAEAGAGSESRGAMAAAGTRALLLAEAAHCEAEDGSAPLVSK